MRKRLRTFDGKKRMDPAIAKTALLLEDARVRTGARTASATISNFRRGYSVAVVASGGWFFVSWLN